MQRERVYRSYGISSVASIKPSKEIKRGLAFHIEDPMEHIELKVIYDRKTALQLAEDIFAHYKQQAKKAIKDPVADPVVYMKQSHSESKARLLNAMRELQHWKLDHETGMKAADFDRLTRAMQQIKLVLKSAHRHIA